MMMFCLVVISYIIDELTAQIFKAALACINFSFVLSSFYPFFFTHNQVSQREAALRSRPDFAKQANDAAMSMAAGGKNTALLLCYF